MNRDLLASLREKPSRQEERKLHEMMLQVGRRIESSPMRQAYELGLEAGTILCGPDTPQARAALNQNLVEARKLGILL